MIDFCILGSGIAGSTIANLLSRKYSLTIFDKARGPGGRAANKRYKSTLTFDHGVQYISPKTKQFKKFIENLEKKNVLKLWNGNHLDFTFNNKDQIKRYIGKKANNDICKYQIKKIKQNYLSQIVKITDKKKFWEVLLKNKSIYKFKSIILTCPYPQLKKLAKNYLDKKILNLNIKMKPNITVMLTIKNHKNLPISSIKFNDNILAWAANENSKMRFKSDKILWTLQCTETFSKKIINLYKMNLKKYENIIIKRFVKLTNYKAKDVVFQKIHGWKYAYANSKTNLDSLWYKNNLGVCADWLNGTKVEDAWLSANSLNNKIKKNPPKRRV